MRQLICRVCDHPLEQSAYTFAKSLGTRGYFRVVCPSGHEYVEDEHGDVGRMTCFTTGGAPRNSLPSAG